MTAATVADIAIKAILNDDVFLTLPGLIQGVRVSLKLEYCHLGGSIKVKPALAMLQALEANGDLKPGGHVVESSSGNLGVALAGLCAQRGYRFTCVIDTNTSPANVRHLRALGADIVLCRVPDANGGFLASRIDATRRFLTENPGAVWTNQYDNECNPESHYRWTAPAILRNRPEVTSLYVGCGTTGTVIGCSRYMRDHAPEVDVIPVDTIGSVIFGRSPGPRKIPGMGASRRPELIARNEVGKPVLVHEVEGIRMCRLVACRFGVLIGGSSGCVLAGLMQDAPIRSPGRDVVVIAADSGERYLETVFDDEWVDRNFPGCLGDTLRWSAA